jgi:hypothetical protein
MNPTHREQTLVVDRWFVALQMLAAIALGGIAPLLVTIQSWPGLRSGSPLPGGWSPVTLAALYVGGGSFITYFVLRAYARTHVCLESEALMQRGPLRTTCIRWSQIRTIKPVGRGFHVEGEAATIIFNPRFFENPNVALEDLLRRARDHGAPV